MAKIVICLNDLLTELRIDFSELYESLTDEEIADIVVDVAMLLVERETVMVNIHIYGSYLLQHYPFDEYDRLELHEMLVHLARELEYVYAYLRLFDRDKCDYIPHDFNNGILILDKPEIGASIHHSDSLASFRIRQNNRTV